MDTTTTTTTAAADTTGIAHIDQQFAEMGRHPMEIDLSDEYEYSTTNGFTDDGSYVLAGLMPLRPHVKE
jgi:hypothetical protein